MTWGELGSGARELAEAVHADGYAPDMVLAIARGGLLVAGALGYALDVKNTFTMNVEFYTGVDERLEMPMILPPVPGARRSRGGPRPDRRRRRRHGPHAPLVKEFCAGKVGEVALRRPLREARSPRSAASTSGGAPTAGSTSRGAPGARRQLPPVPRPDAVL